MKKLSILPAAVMSFRPDLWAGSPAPVDTYNVQLALGPGPAAAR